jgi:DNA-binding response OmpR family regulator
MRGDVNNQHGASVDRVMILIVDDDQNVRASCGNFLWTKGYQILDAPNGDQALELIENEDIDIVISDVAHPGADILAIIEAAGLSNGAAVIVLSGTVPEMVNPVDLKNAGASAVRKKPMNLFNLEKIIRRILDRKKQAGSQESFFGYGHWTREPKYENETLPIGVRAKPGAREVVYGSYNDYEIIFLPVATARHYAKLHSYHRDGVTFEKLFYEFPEVFHLIMGYFCAYYHEVELPPSAESSCEAYYIRLLKQLYEELVDRGEWIGPNGTYRRINSFVEFTDFYRSKLAPGERLPLSDDLFSTENFDYHTLMELMNFEPRIDWAPERILTELGFWDGSPMHGDVTWFMSENQEKIVEAFEDSGFICSRNDKLIANAYGLWPSGEE